MEFHSTIASQCQNLPLTNLGKSSHPLTVTLSLHLHNNIIIIRRYAFRHGKAYFIIMSTEHNFEEGSAQYKAIKKYLKKVDRTATPWVIIGGHR